MPDMRRLDGATFGSLGLLVASNVVANVSLPHRWYVPWNVAVTAGTLTLTTGLGGRTRSEVGLSPATAARGLAVGAAAAALVGSVVGGAMQHSTTRRAFVDDRGNVPGRELAVNVLFHVPAGTALLEEVAFRGALPALFEARNDWTHRRAVAVSSVLFGTWHILPSLQLNSTNETLGSRLGGRSGQIWAVAVSVVTTSVAGMAFSWLRDRSGSLVAPIVAHSAVNAAGHVAAWQVARQPGTRATRAVHAVHAVQR